MTDAATTTRRPWAYAIFLVIAGFAAWWAAFQLTLDKFALYEDKNAVLSCNFSLLVQCGKNLNSPEGSAFGFPNPLIGLGGFAAVVAVGVALLAGAKFDKWFWWAFNLGIAGALAFVIWLIAQSIFTLNVLCPWCMLVWAVTIPLFWITTIRNAATGVFGRRLEKAGRVLQPYAIPLVLVSYVAVAIVAQARLDVLSYIF